MRHHIIMFHFFPVFFLNLNKSKLVKFSSLKLKSINLIGTCKAFTFVGLHESKALALLSVIL